MNPTLRLVLLTAAFLTGAALDAAPPAISVRQNAPLRFGSFMVFGHGSRGVGTGGEVLDSGIVGTTAEAPGPATFTVSYDRGNESRRALDITVEVTVSHSGHVTLGAITASLSNLTSDLAGGASLVAGRPVRITLAGCAQRVCSRAFRVGGRIDVTRSHGSGQITFPLLVGATVVSVD